MSSHAAFTGNEVFVAPGVAIILLAILAGVFKFIQGILRGYRERRERADQIAEAEWSAKKARQAAADRAAQIADVERALNDARRTRDKASCELEDVQRVWAIAYTGFAAIDVETTGLKAAKSKVIQLAIVTFEGGEITNTWATYLNPGVRIPPSATKVNQITDTMLKGKPTFVDLSREIRRRLDAQPLVAHNLRFDTGMLVEEFDRAGEAGWNRPRFGYCTMREDFGRPLEAEDEPRDRPRYRKLRDVMRDHGVQPRGPLHDAINDAIGCGEVFMVRARQAVMAAQARMNDAQQAVDIAEARLARAWGSASPERRAA